jgi:hypothetical protein
MSQSRKTYTRDDDGCLMVEISDNVYVEYEWAERYGYLR